eukprot:1065860_1
MLCLLDGRTLSHHSSAGSWVEQTLFSMDEILHNSIVTSLQSSYPCTPSTQNTINRTEYDTKTMAIKNKKFDHQTRVIRDEMKGERINGTNRRDDDGERINGINIKGLRQ